MVTLLPLFSSLTNSIEPQSCVIASIDLFKIKKPFKEVLSKGFSVGYCEVFCLSSFLNFQPGPFETNCNNTRFPHGLWANNNEMRFDTPFSVS